jgi:peptidoglycan-N-acetylglucosamine deacetylase
MFFLRLRFLTICFLCILYLIAFLPACFSQGIENQFSNCIALTFDDGPHPVLTPRLLSILSSEGVKGTFYLVGSRVVKWQGLVRQIYDAGNEVGNHSWDHALLTRLSSQSALSEIKRTDAAIESVIGIEPKTIRPPYGAKDLRMVSLFLPRQLILWNIDTLDWLHRVPRYIEKEATSGTGIVLMHDIHSTTIDAVPAIIHDLKIKGARFVTVSEYISEGAPHRKNGKNQR